MSLFDMLIGGIILYFAVYFAIRKGLVASRVQEEYLQYSIKSDEIINKITARLGGVNYLMGASNYLSGVPKELRKEFAREKDKISQDHMKLWSTLGLEPKEKYTKAEALWLRFMDFEQRVNSSKIVEDFEKPAF